MKKKRSTALALLAFAAASFSGVAQAAHPFGFDDLIHARRLGAWDVSPDGAWAAWAVTTIDPVESRSTSAIFLGAVGGGEARQLTLGAKHDGAPRFSPDGRRLAFTSDRDGAPQIYLIDLAGGEARALTHLSSGLGDPVWSPDGKFLVASSEVFPDCPSDACNKERSERMEKPKATGRVIERLLFRHWDAFRDGRRSHLFRVDAATGEARDLTPGDFDAPPFGGAPGYDVAPDGKSIVFSSNHDKMEAASTNSDLWEIPEAGGAPSCLSCENRGFDGSPRYSPDGRFIAYRAQRTPAYESDKFELRLYDRRTKKTSTLGADFDDWVEDFTFTRDGKSIVFTSTVNGHMPIYSIPVSGGPARAIAEGITAGDPHWLPDGGVIFSRVALTRPAELYRYPAAALAGQHSAGADKAIAVTHLNDALFHDVTMGEVRERWYAAADGRKVQAWMVLPPGFDEKKKYPALLWVHGGPQGAWEDGWSYRWNPEVLASSGYVVYLPNPRGSVGYGQAFVRGVSNDWGGKVYQDLMRATDDLESLPFVQKDKVGAAGASFGGFMINWFQGHTDRYKALFCHDGISDQEAQYATEELWFPEFEFGGSPWNSPQYRKWSPIASADHFKTPELIVHGEKDYRIPVEQALLMFTTLQRRGVPSKLLLFPDENHWVLKAANARLWYASMIDWFHHYLGGAPADPRALESAYSFTR